MTPARKRGLFLKREDWFVVGPALIAVAFGIAGFIGFNPNAPKVSHSEDPIFRALALLTGSIADANGSPCLRVARWFAVIFAFAAATRFLARNLGATLTRRRTRFAKHHEVVIGLGRKGGRLLALEPRTESDHELRGLEKGNDERPDIFRRIWRRRFWRLERVGVDRDADVVEAVFVAKHNLTIVGDAATDEVLETICVADARKVIVATKADALNVAIAERITRLPHVASRRRPLHLAVHVADPLLRNEAFQGTTEDASVILSPFALPATAASTVLRRFPAAVRAREYGAPGANLVFVGFDDYAEAVLVHALRLGGLRKQAHPRVTVFAARAEDVEERLRRRYAPAYEDTTFGLGDAIRVLPFDPARELDGGDVAPAEPTGRPVTAVFVQAETDAAAYALALKTRRAARALGAWKAPFFVRLDEPDALAGLIHLPSPSPPQGTKVSPILEEVLEPYGALATTLEASVYEGRREARARNLHALYLNKHAGDARPVARDDWHRLAEETREANRRAVDHFGLKLASAGFVVRGDELHARGPLGLAASALGPKLARLEHASWSREKLLAGWRFGTPRNNARRRHDCLTTYATLTPDLQKLDLEQIEDVERILVHSRPSHEEPTIFRERVIAVACDIVATHGEEITRLRVGLGRQLAKLDADDRAAPVGDELWTLVMPLGPGCGSVLLRELADAMRRLSRRFRVLVVQPLPLHLLVAAWCDRGGFALGTPDGVSAVEAAAQRDERGVLRKRDGALIPDHRKIEALVRKLSKDPRLPIDAYVDLSPAPLSVSTWTGEAFTKTEPFLVTLAEGAARLAAYALDRAEALVAVCSATPEEPANLASALLRAWSDAGRKDAGVIRLDEGA